MGSSPAMPIYEYYCPDNNRIYQFFAKTLAQGATVPRCPDNPAYRMEKIMSSFAVSSARKSGGLEGGEAASATGGEAEDPRMEAALGAMEREFSQVDERDPRAMGRMMRRLSELSGEKIDGEMEEVVRKLEEGVDPEKLEEQLGGEDPGSGDEPYEGLGGGPGSDKVPTGNEKEPKARYKARRGPPVRDPKLYDYEQA